MNQEIDDTSLEETQQRALRAIQHHLDIQEPNQDNRNCSLSGVRPPVREYLVESTHPTEARRRDLETILQKYNAFSSLKKEQKQLIIEITSVINSLILTQFQLIEQLSIILVNLPDQTVCQTEQLQERITQIE